MKKATVVTAGIALVLAVAYSQRTVLIERVLAKGMLNAFGANAVTELEDGLHIALCGAGGPLPAPHASGPCVAVVAGKQLFVVDVGTDSPRNLGRMSYQAGDVAAVFLTHFHSDHIDGLGELATLRWAGGDNTSPLPVYGPQGVGRVVYGFNEAYAQDFVYRHEHHGDLVAPASGAGLIAMAFPTPPPGQLAIVFESEELTVEALRVDHFPVVPAVGYRFTYKGRTVLISGDTKRSANLAALAEGADLLIHEALAPNLVSMMQDTAEQIQNPIFTKAMADIPDYHTSPVEAAEIARDAGVGHLLYYHIVPPLLLPGQDALFLNGADAIFGDYTIGVDGVSFSLPANTNEIIKTRDGL